MTSPGLRWLLYHLDRTLKYPVFQPAYNFLNFYFIGSVPCSMRYYRSSDRKGTVAKPLLKTHFFEKSHLLLVMCFLSRNYCNAGEIVVLTIIIIIEDFLYDRSSRRLFYNCLQIISK